MKILKVLLIFLFIFTIYGCEENEIPTYGLPTISNISDIEYMIGDEIPNYLDGISAMDHLGNPITTIQVIDDEVNYNEVGTYNVYYKVTDQQGSKITATITLTVIEENKDIDYGAPYFTGIENIIYYIGQDIPDYQSQITAYDDVDGDLTETITFEGEVDYETKGAYTIKVTVYDQTGNRNIETFTIIVEDNQEPVISGYHRIYYTIGNESPDYKNLIEVYDQEDGDMTEVLEVNDALVDLTIPGIYPLYYNVIDSFNHEVEQIVSVQVEENDETLDIDQLNVYYINDTHGSILEFENEMGLAKIGNVVVNDYAQNPYETLFLSGGDILQGNVLSNFYYGASMIDMLNYMDLEVFVLGNHEFDWGLDRVIEYFNPNTLGTKAEFPLLAANLFYKDTTIRPDHVDAYAIIEKGDLKIGVVGVIGSGLESSIAKSRVEDYEFASPTYWTQYYTKLLRTEYDVDVVFAINHGTDSYYNQTLSLGSEDLEVNGIFNGHNHLAYADLLNGVPVMQSASNARALGHISFGINTQNELSINRFENLFGYNESRLLNEHVGLSNLISTYEQQIAPLLNEAILYSSQSYDRDILTTFMAEVIRKSANADIGIHNTGGTRDSLSAGQAITVGTTYKIFPFDNQIISVQILGSKVLSLFNNSSVRHSLKEGLTEDDIDPNLYYWVSTNDYVFGNYDEFQVYEDIYYPNVVDRVAFEDELRERSETTDQFIID